MLSRQDFLGRACAALLLLASALGGPVAARAEVVTLLADRWCPYNCDPDSDRPGFVVEIVREALEPAGHRVDYRVLNWLRSIERVRKGEAHAVIGAVPEEVPDFVLGPVIGRSTDAVALRKGDQLDLSREDPLEGRVLGAINGYVYAEPIEDYILEHARDRSKVQFAAGERPLEQNLRKLLAGRVDVVAEVDEVLRHALGEFDLENEVDVILAEDPADLHIAFSPALPNSPRLARELQAGLTAMRASGRLDEIMARYGLEDWE